MYYLVECGLFNGFIIDYWTFLDQFFFFVENVEAQKALFVSTRSNILFHF